MKKLLYLLTIITTSICISQPNNYYQSCAGLEGEELREELHNIIKDHTSFSYTTTKSILRDADEDPNNSDNIILLYSGNSIDKFDFASGVGSEMNDLWNREHVWPKSHGDFNAGDPFEVPLFTDAHNLKPADYNMNNARGDKDFDNGGNVVLNGSIATECFSTSSTFEPRDEVKGDVARIILYMDVRYEGGSNEPNLVPVDGLTTFPNPQIGDLSTLLEWHAQDPPDGFEKRRNDVIYQWQGNRNPFIDYPEFVDIIYGDASPNSVEITQVNTPETINGGEGFNIFADVTSLANCGPIESVIINYGNSWSELNNSVSMDLMSNWGAYIPAQPYNTMFCYSIIATDCTGTSTAFYGSQVIPPFPFEGVITTISEIQGQQEFSPYEGQTVNTTGIVTGAFANSFYIQDGSEPWSGIYIYSSGGLVAMGDSVIVSGEVSEFCWDGSSPCNCSACGGAGVTEFYQPEDIYVISNNNPLPEPIVVPSGQALSEEYEGVLVRIEGAECTSLPSGFGVWQVNDGSGECGIHNTPDGYEFDPQVGEAYNITGIVTSTFDEWKIDLRIPSDVESGPDVVPPFVATHECYNVEIGSPGVPAGNYVYLNFNEPIDPSFLDINNFAITNASISAIFPDFIDPTKVILMLDNVISNSMYLTITEMGDLNQNTGPVTYSINCDFNIDDVDILPPFIESYDCDYSETGNYINLNFNEPIDPGSLDIDNFSVFNAEIQSVSQPTGDQPSVLLELTNITANSIFLTIDEISDLNQNIATNLVYNIECDVNIDIHEINQNFNLFPNPNSGKFQIELSNDINTINIFDIKGQLVFTNKFAKGKHTVNINNTGFYYLEINNTNKIPLIIY